MRFKRCEVQEDGSVLAEGHGRYWARFARADHYVDGLRLVESAPGMLERKSGKKWVGDARRSVRRWIDARGCAICEEAPGTVDAEWDDRLVKVCSRCFEYETGEKPQESE